jgi:branched-chain amino acid transport system ATP-binding protein
MGEPLLVIHKIFSGYANLPVIDGVSLSVDVGQFVAIVGPNGHGKTTLLKTISGLIPVRSGNVVFAGDDITNQRADRTVEAGLVHVPQGDLLFPDMTVRENLLMGAYATERDSDVDARLADTFDFLPKLRDRQDQIASTLSGGERRMCGIGRGLMAGGRLLMLDEPSLGLAPIVIDQIYELIDHLKATGRTILLVEENAQRIFERVDRVYLLDNGRVAWEGAGAELMRRREVVDVYLGG